MATKRSADGQEVKGSHEDSHTPFNPAVSASSTTNTNDDDQPSDAKRVKLEGDVEDDASRASTQAAVAVDQGTTSTPSSSSTTAIVKREEEENGGGDTRGNRGRSRPNDRSQGGGGGYNTNKRGNQKQQGGSNNFKDKKKWQRKGDDSSRRGGGGERQHNSDKEEGATNNDGTPKLPKKKVAMLIGYSGLGYSGSQINPGVTTIESEVFAACVKAGAVSADNSSGHAKVSLMRAARTDAGVSAAINVLNLKLILNPPDLPEGMALREYINTFLPPSIRVWDIIRTQGSFHSRTMCDSRMYNYSLPSYVFLEPKPDTLMEGRVSWKNEEEKEKSYWRAPADTKKEEAEVGQPVAVKAENDAGVPAEKAEESSVTGEQASNAGAADSTTSTTTNAPTVKEKAPSSFALDQIRRKQYRIPKETLWRVRETMNRFLGSHNFWNYTVGKEFSDRSCQRVMKALTVSDPFIVGDYEWISLKFHGQSFMLHQIRKMVAMIVMVVRTHTPSSLIPETFGPTRLNIPKAPALGLLLEQPRFDHYNRKVDEQNRAIANRAKKAAATSSTNNDDDGQGTRDPIQYDHIHDEVETFKIATVVKAMHEEEERDDTYAKWLNLHDSQIGTDFDYLNAKGVIPPSAVPSKKKTENKAIVASDASIKTSSPSVKQESEDSTFKVKVDSDDDDEVLRLQRSGKGAADLEG